MVADALDSCGITDQAMSADIRPLHTQGAVWGRAVTLQFAPDYTVPAEPYDDIISFIDSLDSNDFVVISSGSDRSALWGELFSAAALGRGAAGMVCDGLIRDSDKVRALGFPVFCRGTRPLDFRARQFIVSLREPVACGGVIVHPDDAVVADADGVVVVPENAIVDVAAAARQKASRELDVLDELQSGTTLRSVWDRHRIL